LYVKVSRNYDVVAVEVAVGFQHPVQVYRYGGGEVAEGADLWRAIHAHHQVGLHGVRVGDHFCCEEALREFADGDEAQVRVSLRVDDGNPALGTRVGAVA
jgi:hypothetical protein